MPPPPSLADLAQKQNGRNGQKWPIIVRSGSKNATMAYSDNWAIMAEDDPKMALKNGPKMAQNGC